MTEKKDQGYTMIVVICLMFLFMALALAMLFSSAQVLARAERAAAQKQSRVSAVSFAGWMDVELGNVPDYTAGDPKNLCACIEKRFQEKSWPAYTGDLGNEAEVAILTFTPKSGTGTSGFPKELGDLEVKMYWETEEGGTDPEDPQADLVVTVKAVVQGEQFSVTTRYAKQLVPGADGAEAAWNGTWYVRGRE